MNAPFSRVDSDMLARRLMQRHDTRTEQERLGTDDNLQSLGVLGMEGPGYPNMVAENFNRMQEDSAMGPNGFNRQWVPFLEQLRDMKLEGGIKSVLGDPAPGIRNDPTSTWNTNVNFAPYVKPPGPQGAPPQEPQQAAPPMPAPPDVSDPEARLDSAVGGLKKKRPVQIFQAGPQ